MKFSDINLKPSIMKAIEKLGYEDLTPIQEKTFPYVIEGKDIIALAETGSGKTLACGIPIVQSVDPAENTIQALVLVPTRELALQYVSAISDVAKYSDIAPFAVYGGFSMDIQKAKLSHGVHVLIATPGRLIDLLSNTPLSLSSVRTLILDEADEMLNMGFLTDIDFVVSCLIHEHQTLLFSATMPPAIKKLAKKYLKDPVTLELNSDQISPQSLIHQFQQITREKKLPWLLQYIKTEKPKQTILFCQSRKNCDKLYDSLKKEVDSVEMIHGGLEQSKRSSIFKRFKSGQIDMIVATGIAGRGLDFSHVTHVINYDFPENPQTYTHRSGRTARMGRKGVAVTLFGRGDLQDLKRIIDSNNITPVWLSTPPDMDKISSAKRRPGSFAFHRGRKSSHPGHKHKRPTKK